MTAIPLHLVMQVLCWCSLPDWELLPWGVTVALPSVSLPGPLLMPYTFNLSAQWPTHHLNLMSDRLLEHTWFSFWYLPTLCISSTSANGNFISLLLLSRSEILKSVLWYMNSISKRNKTGKQKINILQSPSLASPSKYSLLDEWFRGWLDGCIQRKNGKMLTVVEAGGTQAFPIQFFQLFLGKNTSWIWVCLAIQFLLPCFKPLSSLVFFTTKVSSLISAASSYALCQSPLNKAVKWFVEMLFNLSNSCYFL